MSVHKETKTTDISKIGTLAHPELPGSLKFYYVILKGYIYGQHWMNHDHYGEPLLVTSSRSLF